MAATGSRVTVTAAPTLLTGADSGTVVAAGSYVIRNKGAVSVDLGGADVATGAGFELASGESASFQLLGGGSIYGVVASGTCRVDVLRLRP